MKTKLKLSLLDDYLAISKMLVCNNFSENENLKIDCQNLLKAINSVFENKKDFAFAIFKQQVSDGIVAANTIQFQQNLPEQNVLEQFNVLRQSVQEKINKLS